MVNRLYDGMEKSTEGSNETSNEASNEDDDEDDTLCITSEDGLFDICLWEYDDM